MKKALFFPLMCWVGSAFLFSGCHLFQEEKQNKNNDVSFQNPHIQGVIIEDDVFVNLDKVPTIPDPEPEDINSFEKYIPKEFPADMIVILENQIVDSHVISVVPIEDTPKVSDVLPWDEPEVPIDEHVITRVTPLPPVDVPVELPKLLPAPKIIPSEWLSQQFSCVSKIEPLDSKKDAIQLFFETLLTNSDRAQSPISDLDQLCFEPYKLHYDFHNVLTLQMLQDTKLKDHAIPYFKESFPNFKLQKDESKYLFYTPKDAQKYKDLTAWIKQNTSPEAQQNRVMGQIIFLHTAINWGSTDVRLQCVTQIDQLLLFMNNLRNKQNWPARGIYGVLYAYAKALDHEVSLESDVAYSSVLARELDGRQIFTPSYMAPRYESLRYLALQRKIFERAKSPVHSKVRYFSGLELYYARLRAKDYVGAAITLHMSTLAINVPPIPSWMREVLIAQFGVEKGTKYYESYIKMACLKYRDRANAIQILRLEYYPIKARELEAEKKYDEAIRCWQQLDPTGSHSEIQFKIREIKKMRK